MKYSCKFWNKRTIQKKLAFSSFQWPFGRGDEIRSLSMGQSDEIKPLQTVTSSLSIKNKQWVKCHLYPVGLYSSARLLELVLHVVDSAHIQAAHSIYVCNHTQDSPYTAIRTRCHGFFRFCTVSDNLVQVYSISVSSVTRSAYPA